MQSKIETLDDNVINTMIQELNALEKNPANGWNITYPTLYNTLYSLIESLSSKLNIPTPQLFIDFQGIQRHQSSSHLMTDGTTQLHIGVDFIRDFLLKPSSDNRRKMYQSFRWTIAHELSHFSDPNFKLFGHYYSYVIRLFLDKMAPICFFLGMVGMITNASFSNLLIPSIIVIALKKFLITVLHRRFEYYADKRSASIIDEFDPQDMKVALTTMTENINKSLSDSAVVSVNPLGQLLSWVFRKFSHIQTFLLHPSIKSRIDRTQAIYK